MYSRIVYCTVYTLCRIFGWLLYSLTPWRIYSGKPHLLERGGGGYWNLCVLGDYNIKVACQYRVENQWILQPSIVVKGDTFLIKGQPHTDQGQQPPIPPFIRGLYVLLPVCETCLVWLFGMIDWLVGLLVCFYTLGRILYFNQYNYYQICIFLLFLG